MATEQKKESAQSARDKEELKKLAPDRVKRAIQAINSVGNLGQHHPTEQQVEAIAKPIEDAAKAIRASLNKSTTASGSGFTLPE